MNFFSTKSPTKHVSKNQFRDRFHHEIVVVGDMRSPVGRPRKSVLGSERLQITQPVGMRIAKAMIEQMQAEGEVFDLTAQKLYDARDLADFVQSQLRQMAAIDKKASDNDPFAAINKLFNVLMTVEYRRVARGRPMAVRIVSASATPLEIRAALSLIWRRGQNEARNADAAVATITRALDMMAAGETLEEASARHFEDIRAGRYRPNKLDDDEGDDD